MASALTSLRISESEVPESLRGSITLTAQCSPDGSVPTRTSPNEPTPSVSPMTSPRSSSGVSLPESHCSTRSGVPRHGGHPPPPPSGTTQSMFCEGHLMSHVLQWMQFCALIWSCVSPASSVMYLLEFGREEKVRERAGDGE